MKKFLLIGLLLIGSMMVALGVTISCMADKPGLLASTHDVVLPEGTGIISIGRLLEKEGVIRSHYLFPFFYVLLEYHRPLKAGEYEFAAGASYRQVMRTLGSGITVVRKFTVPEGMTVAQIYKMLNENHALKGDLPAPAVEGTLLPETYYYSFGDSRSWLVERMQKATQKFVMEAWNKRSPNLPFSKPMEALTLASIIEKETAVPAERAHVASVYINRLRKGMKLQADPTVAYGITKGEADLGRGLTHTDLETPTDYNTYSITGLPPTPIANPGKESIQAALNPLETKDLFFVADGKGGHSFSPSFAQHDKNVMHYHAELRKEKALKKAGKKAEAAALHPKKKTAEPKAPAAENSPPAPATPKE